MRHEQERQPQPTWQKTLTDFQRARDRYVEEPTTGNLIFTRVFHERLRAELEKPGKFELGRTLATPGAMEELNRSSQMAEEFLIQHKQGAWGEIDEQDREENELSLREGFRLMSAYTTKGGERLWVITEHDRSLTTALLPSEY